MLALSISKVSNCRVDFSDCYLDIQKPIAANTAKVIIFVLVLINQKLVAI